MLAAVSRERVNNLGAGVVQILARLDQDVGVVQDELALVEAAANVEVAHAVGQLSMFQNIVLCRFFFANAALG